ncbi:MAG TPA: NYN domain-containing protein [Candidatus Saccharimonadales bacterium]|nr:NYN domain-containing protein [Candidatus Saccharimonadales bacterium]
MRQERCVVLIDGSNFYFKLKNLELHNLLSLDLSGFLHSLIDGNELVSATYYVGAVKTDGTAKTQTLFNNQRKLLAHLRKHQVRYSLGYLLKSDGVFHEKGVDVKLAVDMLVATYEDQCDRILLVSSDTDLLPAIKKAQEKGKKVEYVGFSHKPSVALVKNCDETTLLKKEDVARFIQS